MVGGFRHDGTNHEPSTCRMSGGRRLEHCRIVRSMGAASDILEELCAGDGWVPLQMDGAAMEHRRPNDVSLEKKIPRLGGFEYGESRFT